jgi:hypothetical protein
MSKRNSTHRTKVRINEEGRKYLAHIPLLMRQGRALIEVREMLGPSAHVQRRGRHCVILDRVGGRDLAAGASWEGALRELRNKNLKKVEA